MNEPITQAPTVAHHDHERHWSGAFPARPPTPAAGSSEFPAPPVDTFCQRIGVAYVDVNSITPGYSVRAAHACDVESAAARSDR
jgi:hypothetical protein